MLAASGLSGWRFAFDEAVRRCGACHFSSRKITLSKFFALDPDVSDAAIADVIIHECAHAVAGPTAGHGHVWLLVAQALGGSGDRCVNHRMRVEGNIIVSCRCGHAFTRFRMSKKLRYRRCADCGKRLRNFRLETV